jgi:hypothetical protein
MAEKCTLSGKVFNGYSNFELFTKKEHFSSQSPINKTDPDVEKPGQNSEGILL